MKTLFIFVSIISIVASDDRAKKKSSPSYTVCNGMSNQLLGHFSSLSQAIMNNNNNNAATTTINMPNAFIYNGVQSENAHTGKWDDVLPTSSNSIPFDKVFDIEKIRNVIQELSESSVELNVVPINDKRNKHKHKNKRNIKMNDDRLSSMVENEEDDNDEDGEVASLSCDGWLNRLSESDPMIVLGILHHLSPSPLLQRYVDRMIRKMGGGMNNGVCLHHRDGEDWHNHCKHWENIPDGVWRKNCLAPKGVPLGKLVKDRLVHSSNNNTTKTTLFYVGDHDPPTEELSPYGFHIVSRKTLLGSKGEKELLRELLGEEMIDDNDENRRAKYRDLWAVLDFMTCSQMGSFVGNSVSTWTTLQLALRNGKGTWYNSRSIPLSTMLPLFPIPIVYTYTEQSQLLGKIMMQASILSVRQNMGNPIMQPIHVMYHGNQDREYMRWLKSQGVILHKHEPNWIDMIERMRLAGNPERSHLFKHQGNYLGTWQRIDIPDLIEAEYVLLLDADTIVNERFTIADFGLDITSAISFSLEGEKDEGLPWNAGVALMNVPKLRATKRDFMAFIESVEAGYATFSAPSDQGAYLDFYHPEYLNRKFNIKAYFNDMRDMKVLHFHGPKPFELFQLLTGEDLSFLMTKTIARLQTTDTLCMALHRFAVSASMKSNLIPDYCTAAAAVYKGENNNGSGNDITAGCIDFMKRLSISESSHGCHTMATAYTNADISFIRNIHSNNDHPQEMDRHTSKNGIFFTNSDTPFFRNIHNDYPTAVVEKPETANLRFVGSGHHTLTHNKDDTAFVECYLIVFAFLALSIHYFCKIKWSTDRKKSCKDSCCIAATTKNNYTSSSSNPCKIKICLLRFGIVIFSYQALTLLITVNFPLDISDTAAIFFQRPFRNSNYDTQSIAQSNTTSSSNDYAIINKLDGRPIQFHQKYICELFHQVYGSNVENEIKVVLDYEAGPFTNLGNRFHCDYPGSHFDIGKKNNKADGISIDAEVIAVDSRAPYYNTFLNNKDNSEILRHRSFQRTSFCSSMLELANCVGHDSVDFAINIDSLSKSFDPPHLIMAQSLLTVREGGLSCFFFNNITERNNNENWTLIASGKGFYHWDFWLNEDNKDIVLEDTKTGQQAEINYIFRHIAKRINTQKITDDDQELVCYQVLPKDDLMYS